MLWFSRSSEEGGRLDETRLMDGILLLMGAILGSILIDSSFFKDFVAQGDAPTVVGVIGFLGTVAYFTLLAFAPRPSIDRWRYFIIITIAVLTLLGLTERSMIARFNSPHRVWVVSDGMVQIESAANLLLHGQNPYSADFTSTAHGWRIDPDKSGQYDPARTHYAYPPGSTLVLVPIILVANLLHVAPDGRWVSIIALIVLWVLLIRRQPSLSTRSRMTLLTIGNPLLYLLAVSGFNDLVMITAVIGAAVWGQRGRWIWSAVWLAIAVATKQTSWLFVPLWFIWLWSASLTKPKKIWSVSVFFIVSAAIFLPFIAWNVRDFMTDVIWYPAGVLTSTYVISGPTLFPYLIIWTHRSIGLTVSLQLLVSGLGLLLGALMVRRRPSASWWLIGGVVATSLAAMVHSFFYYNYAIGLMTLVIGAGTLHQHDQAQS